MTPLRLPSFDLPERRAAVTVIAALLLATPLAGCLGADEPEDDGDEPVDGFRVFLAALGSPGGAASATLSNVGVALEGQGTTLFLTLRESAFDLADLADSGQAVLAAAGADVNGSVTETVLVFQSLTVNGSTLSNVRLEVPFEYPAGNDVEVTVTLDLDATTEAGAPRLANLVADRDGERLAAVTGAELELGEREEVQPLPTPTITVEALEGNDTAPSFHVNTPISFGFTLPGVEPSAVRDAFWTFSDGTTTSGLEVEQTFRQSGPATASVLVEGTRGQQARATVVLDIYFTQEGQGNVGVGTAGTGAVEGRDVKDEHVDVPGPFTSISVRVEHSPSANLCEDALGCAPSNVFIELYDSDMNLLGENATTTQVKFINVTEELPEGEYILRVKGDQGVAVGYAFRFEVHYLGVCPEGAGDACPA